MQVKIEKIVYPGKSLTKAFNKIVFTDEGLPEELIEIEILKEKKNYFLAKTKKVLKASNQRTSPLCSHYKICSPYQYIKYPYQVEIKINQLKEMLKHNLKLEIPNLRTKTPNKIWGYRNKVKLKINWLRSPSLFYHLLNSQDKFIKIKECFLLPTFINDFLKNFLQIVKNRKIKEIEEIEIKYSESRDQILLVIYTNSLNKIKNEIENFKGISERLSGIVLIPKNSSKKIVSNKEYLEEKIENIILRWGANSFFQINLEMLKELLKDLNIFLNLKGKEKIADLYCGVGTFGIYFAKKTKQVIGIEQSKENIYFLKENLKINNLDNFIALQGKSEVLIDYILKEKIDILIMDPPRRGLEYSLCEKILKKSPPLLCYISCNPSTLIRDLKILLYCYKIKNISFYDFFPHTPHMELCTILEIK
ncbi:MAG: 23S rRNA (uracil(1939)-C(5))-methyltransferase RlmD [Candidatus Aenigmatarchaeota archaeon]